MKTNNKLVAIFKLIAEFFQNLWFKYIRKQKQFTAEKSSVKIMPLPIEITLGQKAVNPEWQWIEVQNPKGRRNGNSFHDFGDSAGIKEGGILTVVAIKDNSVLVSYESPNGQGYGSEAGNGTLFFVKKVIFNGMSKKYDFLKKKKENDKEEIMKLLKQTAIENS